MKKYIKTLLIILSFFFLISLTGLNNVSAENVTTYTDDKAYNYTTTKETKKDLADGVYYIKNEGFTTKSKKDYEQVNHLFVADFKANQDIKIATWAIPNEDGTGFVRKPLKEIALDFEKNNPGWIVLAGTNADQYYPKFGTGLGVDGSCYYYPQPYYPMISNGENWFSISPYASSGNLAGFKNDSSDKQIISGSRSISGLFIYVYDDNNQLIGKFKADDLNLTNELKSGQTTVLSPYKIAGDVYNTISKSSSNDFYIIENADMTWVSNSVEFTWKSTNVNAFFGKGTISKIAKDIELKQDEFAIETSDESLKSALKVGTYVKCQYDFDDGFNGINEGMGYHTVQRSNGKDNNVNNSYNSRPYPRSIFGCDDNGKVYLITCNGSNSSPTKGMYAQESNALMKYYGITDAYQCDGGGSVTCVIRNTKGEIEYSMPAVEGDYRYIFSGLFIAIKVPETQIEITDVDQTSADFKVDMSKVTNDYEKAYLYMRFSGEDHYYEIVDGSCKVEGLKKDSPYSYSLCLETNGVKRKTYLSGSFMTYKDYPVINSVKVDSDGSKYIVTVDFSDSDKVLSKLCAIVDDKYHYFSVSEGIGTLELEKGAYNILNMDLCFTCSMQGKVIEVSTEYTLGAKADIYLDYNTSLLSDFFDKLFK